jgi:hypothetical protein
MSRLLGYVGPPRGRMARRTAPAAAPSGPLYRGSPPHSRRPSRPSTDHVERTLRRPTTAPRLMPADPITVAGTPASSRLSPPFSPASRGEHRLRPRAGRPGGRRRLRGEGVEEPGDVRRRRDFAHLWLLGQHLRRRGADVVLASPRPATTLHPGGRRRSIRPRRLDAPPRGPRPNRHRRRGRGLAAGRRGASRLTFPTGVRPTDVTGQIVCRGTPYPWSAA